ncbi:MAG: hypothetical protein R3E90_04490 [Marinicella sp.]
MYFDDSLAILKLFTIDPRVAYMNVGVQREQDAGATKHKDDDSRHLFYPNGLRRAAGGPDIILQTV